MILAAVISAAAGSASLPSYAAEASGVPVCVIGHRAGPVLLTDPAWRYVDSHQC